VDNEWALQQLQSFVDLTRLEQPRSDGGIAFIGDFASPVGKRSDIVAQAQVIEQILDRVLPTWRTDVPDDGKHRWTRHRDAALRAIAQLRRQDEIAAKLGDYAPTMSVAALHPWVWEGARSLWQSGHFREAVRTASTKVNAETQNKLGRRDTSEQALLQEAFSSDEPQPDRPRLRPAGDDGGKTAKSVRRGIVALAEFCYAALRNPVSHDPLEELAEQHALEQLASLSLLARYIDGAVVVKE
jgi:acid stress-induced BolA-like protein IbaG/YrbA